MIEEAASCQGSEQERCRDSEAPGGPLRCGRAASGDFTSFKLWCQEPVVPLHRSDLHCDVKPCLKALWSKMSKQRRSADITSFNPEPTSFGELQHVTTCRGFLLLAGHASYTPRPSTKIGGSACRLTARQDNNHSKTMHDNTLIGRTARD